MQRIFGLGTIHIDSTDMDLGCVKLINVKNCDSVKEMISNKVEEERLRNRVSAREFLSHGDEDEMDAQMHDVVEEEHE